MLVYGLRLIVALITFGVGVAASSLLGLKSRPDCGKRVLTAYAPVHTGTLADVPPPPPPMARKECRLKLQPSAVEGGILNGKADSKPQPAYPPDAKAARVSGTVAVRVVVSESGRVESAEAVSGPEMLRDAAVEAAREARFAPTRISGEPVRVAGTLTYNFILR